MDSGSLRASDADRDQVAGVLHAAYAEGRITRDEHDERMSALLSARTFAELEALTADLVATSPRSAPTMAPDSGLDEPDRLTAVLSDVKRVGRWRMRRLTIAHAFMASVRLDLTEATLDAPVLEISGTTFLGSLVLRVPPGTTIRDESTKVLGGSSIKGIGDPDPSRPTIVITGINILGDVKVRGPKGPSVWRKALA
ncbi:hypothetical protein JOE57_001559 [Microlunatus panaciterrae]|uniref:DUF1707 domain-containing protein n=1 Tax=Microlunatus panaciterrae TaxID=400768 RepID=A0ABS2RIW2_9ACTN|nr:DUF1707 domain-containing protein [Microlunatus panaciterrae]MBM7798638.1 hypothetical protein [Microlunatus panaciterrae]